ncbi:hypothetical protein JW877_05775 [bacterium]|nr:hypothetical protein [bacterium]
MRAVIYFTIIIALFIAAYFIFFKPQEKAEKAEDLIYEQPMQKGAVRTIQIEAKTMLQALYQKEAAYHAMNGAYTDDIGELSYMLSGRYYELTVRSATADAFIAEARGNIDNDITEDVWRIDHNGKLTNIVDDVSN